MNSKLNLIWIALTLIGLSGCATMNADECVTGDWTAIGYEDGARGYTSDRLAQHRKACAKHGVTPDFVAYQDGREQGLAEYCQPSRGFNIGANGGQYYGVCNAHQEGDFLDAYNTGQHLYVLRSNVNRANSSINSKERELEEIEDLILENGVALISNETTQEERIVLLAEMKDLSERTGELETEIKVLYDVRAQNEAELEQYQLLLADLGY